MHKTAQLPPTRSHVAPTLGVGIGGVAVIGLVGSIGWWWVTFLVGLAIGLVLPRGRRALVVAVIVGGLGCGLPLALLALSAPVGPVAATVAGLVGLPAAVGAIVVILVTLLVGCGLSVVGTWVGLTARGLMPAGEVDM